MHACKREAEGPAGLEVVPVWGRPTGDREDGEGWWLKDATG